MNKFISLAEREFSYLQVSYSESEIQFIIHTNEGTYTPLRGRIFQTLTSPLISPIKGQWEISPNTYRHKSSDSAKGREGIGGEGILARVLNFP